VPGKDGGRIPVQERRGYRWNRDRRQPGHAIPDRGLCLLHSQGRQANADGNPSAQHPRKGHRLRPRITEGGTYDPDITKDRTAFTGEPRLDPDHTVNGYNFSFSIQELRGDAEGLVQKIDDKDAAHQAPATIALEVYKLYREAGAGDIQLLYTEVDMTCDSMSGSGHGYIGSKWSGFARFRTPI
jgi:hypothetical protein